MNNIPGRHEVEQVLSGIYNEFEKAHDTTEVSFLEKIIRAIVDFFSSFGPLAWILFILGAGGITAFIIYRIYNAVGRERRDEKSTAEVFSKDIQYAIPAAEYCAMARTHADKNDYSMAVVFLYRASISVLIESGYILLDSGATNRDILTKIKSKPGYYESFRDLSAWSEHVLFNEEILSEQDYEKAKNSYQRGFM